MILLSHLQFMLCLYYARHAEWLPEDVAAHFEAGLKRRTPMTEADVCQAVCTAVAMLNDPKALPFMQDAVRFRVTTLQPHQKELRQICDLMQPEAGK